jgi:hypothetical protein
MNKQQPFAGRDWGLPRLPDGLVSRPERFRTGRKKESLWPGDGESGRAPDCLIKNVSQSCSTLLRHSLPDIPSFASAQFCDRQIMEGRGFFYLAGEGKSEHQYTR